MSSGGLTSQASKRDAGVVVVAGLSVNLEAAVIGGAVIGAVRAVYRAEGLNGGDITEMISTAFALLGGGLKR